MERQIIRITKYSEVHFKAHIDKAQLYEIREKMSFYAKDYKHTPRYKIGIWNGKIPFIDKDGLFPIGLLPLFVDVCDKLLYDVSFNFNKDEFGEKISDETLQAFFEIVFPPENEIFPRDYQQEAVLKAIRIGRGVLNLATAAGKSLIVYCMVRYLIAKNRNVLIIVPNVSLVEQIFSDFKNDYGYEKANDNICLNYSGKEIDLNKKVLLTTWQSVYKHPESFFERFDAIIVDEAHSMQGKSLSEIGRKCVNAKFRIGLTGTMPQNEADFNTVVGYLGPVIQQVKSKELIEKGVISQIKIKNLILKYPDEMRIKRGTYQREVDDINSYKNRNLALDYIIKNCKDDENILILVSKIDHLRDTKLYLEKKFKNKKIYEIYGDTDADIREEIRKRLEKDSGSILVATYGTFSTGSNVKKLHHIVLFSSYKSQIKVLQSIGRGLRKHESKEFVTVWDCVDEIKYNYDKKKCKNWTYQHWEKNRLEYYQEQEFKYENYYLDI